ncbi:MAG: hypothetical protein AAF570_09750 [Bacteroidota bacterium]
MKFKSFYLTGFLCALLCYSCTFNNAEDLAPECPPVTASFQDTIFSLFQRNCWDTVGTACHQAGATNKPEWTSYANISGQAARIMVRVIQEGTMPLGGGPPGKEPMNDCEKALLKEWLDAGAPNN